MSSRTTQALRGVGFGRVLVGAVALVAAGQDGVPVLAGLPRLAVAAARLLAARDLVQGVALVAAPEDVVVRAARAGTAVDSLHAASMLPVIIFSRRYRSAALLSAASAMVWIAVTAAARQPQSRSLRRSLIQR